MALNNSLIELEGVLDCCGKCGGGDADMKCLQCLLHYHMSCIGLSLYWDSANGICDECYSRGQPGADPRINSTIRNIPPMTPRRSTVGVPMANSTVSLAEHDELKRRCEALEKQVRRLTMGPNQLHPVIPEEQDHPNRTSPQRTSPIVTPRQNPVRQEFHNQRPSLFGTSGVVNRSSMSETWQEQITALNETLQLDQVVRITQEQRDARKTTKRALPPFDGDPRGYVRFVTTFWKSTTACGFTEEENRERLQESLSGAALGAVSDKLAGYGRIDEIMGRLVQCFGAPARLLSGMRSIVATLPMLKENLSNLVSFVGVVEEVEAVYRMIKRDSAQSDLLMEIENKIPPQFRLQWLAFTRGVGTTCGLTELCQFLNQLVSDALIMHLEITETPRAPVLKPKAVCSVVESPPVSPPDVCCICSGNHRIKTCPQFLQIGDADKFDRLKSLKRCFKCLQPYDHRHRCHLQVCGVDNCSQRHLPVLHAAFAQRKSQAQMVAAQTPQLPTPEVLVPSVAIQGHQCSQESDGQAFFKIVPVELVNGGRRVRTLAFFDEGSSVSLIDEALAQELQLEGDVEPLTVKWTDSNMRTERESRCVNVTVRSHGAKLFQLRGLRTSRGLDLPKQRMTRERASRLFPEGDGPEPYDGQPRILLGLPHAHLVAPHRLRRVEGESLIACDTDVGWVIYGCLEDEGSLATLNYRVCHTSTFPSRLERLVSQFYDFESFGVRAAPPQISNDEQRAFAILQRTVRFTGQRYEAGLLWANDTPFLPPSRNACDRRARGLQRRMVADPQLATACSKVIRDYLEKDYVGSVTKANMDASLQYYLPIFPVTNPMKPEKTRIVWDAAASTDGVSLNSQLLVGPDLLTPLPEVLLRFREYAIAVTADISEMFHQVEIRAEDQHVQRFLWIPADSEKVQEFYMKRMTFGPSCSPVIAQYVKNKTADDFGVDFPEAVEAIKRNIYVDDYLGSYRNEATATRVAEQVRDVLGKGGFPLRKWRTNCDKVLQSLEGKPSAAKDLCVPEGRVLGTMWNSLDDTLQFKTHHIQELLDTTILTQRVVLRSVMSVFDPPGFAAQLVMHGKLILREVWREVSSWDEPISSRLAESWRRWCQLLGELDQVRIPRWLGLNPCVPWQLHIFVDASELAFAAVVYVRGMDQSGRLRSSFVMAKTRVAPLRRSTIPRLELQAAVLGARLAKTVAHALTGPIDSRYFWSDSLNVLSWLRSSHRRYSSFVAARVNEILESSREAEWRYCPTAENVADDATRPVECAVSSRWFSGPEFLTYPCEQWPEDKRATGEGPEELLQPVLSLSKVPHSTLLPPLTAMKSYDQYVRVTAYALRFFYRRHSSAPLTLADLGRAEQEIFRALQMECYPEVVSRRQRDPTEALAKGHKLFKLCPVLDEFGVLRVDGRLPAIYPRDVRQPIVLPADHPITVAMIQAVHERYLHCNHATVLQEVRRRFFVFGLRRLVRRVITGCRRCKLLFPRTEQPQMGDLPDGRAMVGWKAFAFCGVDYFGPLEVTVGRRREKRWVSLFTCLTTRAIHMEVVSSLSTDSFIMALRNFMNERHVVPKELHSDNATNFHGAERALRELKTPFSAMQWRYIPPGAPHMGGAWERMIRTVKRNLAVVLGNDSINDETLRCALKEVQAVVNSHPLAHVTLDHAEAPVLTPHDFLDFPGQVVQENSTLTVAEEGLQLRRAWKRAQQVADHFWRRFAKEIVPILNMRTKWYDLSEPLKEGDVVLIADEGRRGNWRRGIVVEASPSRRGTQIRAVRVRTSTGEVLRPAVRIVKLDCAPTLSAHRGGCEESAVGVSERL